MAFQRSNPTQENGEKDNTMKKAEGHREQEHLKWQSFLKPRKISEIRCSLIISTLKKVMKTWDCEKPSNSKAKKVVTPPLMMAGPMLVRLWTALSSRDPGEITTEIIYYYLGGSPRAPEQLMTHPIVAIAFSPRVCAEKRPAVAFDDFLVAVFAGLSSRRPYQLANMSCEVVESLFDQLLHTK